MKMYVFILILAHFSVNNKFRKYFVCLRVRVCEVGQKKLLIFRKSCCFDLRRKEHEEEGGEERDAFE